MKILRKPLYLGAELQALTLTVESEAEGTYAQKTRAGRVAAGKSLVGQRVGLVRVAGKDCVALFDDAVKLSETYRLSITGTLTNCDNSGVISIE